MPAGRPTLLTEDLILKTPELLGRFVYIVTFADFIGVDRRSVHRWLKVGSKALRKVQKSDGTPVELMPYDELCYRFCLTVKRTLAGMQADAVGMARKGELGWQTHWRFLETRWPELYGRGRLYEAEWRRLIAEERKRGDSRPEGTPAAA